MVLDQDVPTVEFKFKITMGIIQRVFIWNPLLAVNVNNTPWTITIYRQEQILKRKFKLELGLQSFLVRMNSCMIPCKQEQSFFCVGAYAT